MRTTRETRLARIRERLALQAGEAAQVRQLGDRIGYGNLMQLAEAVWGDVLEASGLPAGGAHSHYCCATFLVPCPGCEPAHLAGEHCDWCCGAGRVTERVAEAIAAEVIGGQPDDGDGSPR